MKLGSGKYQILEEIGRGGFKVVYKAAGPQDDPLAIAFLKDEYCNVREMVCSFIREAEALQNRDHPNIVRVYDSGIDGIRPFYVSRRYDSTLEHLLKKGHLEARSALNITYDMLSALKYIDGVHGDIKPANIMMDGEKAVLGDFGLFKEKEFPRGPRTTRITKSLILGTPDYMAPEQFNHCVSDVRTDLYSLGVVLFEMLTGERPSMRKPSEYVRLDHAIDDIVVKAVEKDIGKRFQSVDEFIERIDHYRSAGVSKPSFVDKAKAAFAEGYNSVGAAKPAYKPDKVVTPAAKPIEAPIAQNAIYMPHKNISAVPVKKRHRFLPKAAGLLIAFSLIGSMVRGCAGDKKPDYSKTGPFTKRSQVSTTTYVNNHHSSGYTPHGKPGDVGTEMYKLFSPIKSREMERRVEEKEERDKKNPGKAFHILPEIDYRKE